MILSVLRHRPQVKAPTSAFTLSEMLVVAGLLAVLSAVLVPNILRILENQRVFTVASELANWLSQVKTFSMRNVSPCTVTFDPANSNSGQALAKAEVVSGTAGVCAPAGVGNLFLIPEIPAGRFTITVDPAATPFTYTPRGATTNNTPITVFIAAAGQDPLRCVLISPVLGQIRIGSATSVASISTCNL